MAVHLMNLLSDGVVATPVLSTGRIVGSFDQFAAEMYLSAWLQINCDVENAVRLLFFALNLIERNRTVRHTVVGRFWRIVEQLQIDLVTGIDFSGERFVQIVVTAFGARLVDRLLIDRHEKIENLVRVFHLGEADLHIDQLDIQGSGKSRTHLSTQIL